MSAYNPPVLQNGDRLVSLGKETFPLAQVAATLK